MAHAGAFRIERLCIAMIFLAVLVPSHTGCRGRDMNEDTLKSEALDGVDAVSWERLAKKNIFFGHQSVGADIVEGMSRLMVGNGTIRLRIIEGTDPAVFASPAFLHAKIGTNGDPSGKINAFSTLMLGELGDSTNIAFLKFCYNDISAQTNVRKLFEEYERCMSRLKAARPAITFVHVTVPLKSVQAGWKVWIKRLLGRPAGGAEDNAKRNEFNNLMRRSYGTRERLFDLALIEATHLDGSHATFRSGGTTYDQLAREYTDDGGHLNERGRRTVAGRFLVFLAELTQ